MTSQHSITSGIAALALLIGGPAWAQTRPTLQGLQNQLNNTYTRQQVNNLVRTPDPACADNANRYVDCLNGTVTDTVTGLIWLKQADCLGTATYAAAMSAAATLQSGECGLTDGSRPGDWRLPTSEEWKSTLFPGPDCKSPSLTDTAGTGCFADGAKPFTGVQTDVYWSATANLARPATAWSNDLHYSEETSLALNGESSVIARDKTATHRAWPVRGAASSQPVYEDFIIRAQVSEGTSLASGAKALVAEYFLSRGTVPTNNSEADFGWVPTTIVTQVSIDNGRIDITYGNEANAAITGKVLSLTPYDASGGVAWRCGNAPAPGGDLLGTGTGGPVAEYQPTSIDNKYLPPSCRP